MNFNGVTSFFLLDQKSAFLSFVPHWSEALKIKAGTSQWVGIGRTLLENATVQIYTYSKLILIFDLIVFSCPSTA
jgi:hypothetical protein